MSISTIVLAAGQGTRMKSDDAKVLHVAAGRPLLWWVVDALGSIDVSDMVVVVGHRAADVADACPAGATTVVQEPQNGTGHAASIGLSALTSSDATVLIVPGDMPLIEGSSFERLIGHHIDTGAAATVMSVIVDEPTGYGRIVRSGDAVSAIVEERDATETERAIAEINTSVYAFDREVLADALGRVRNDNAQGEYYLTDVIEMLVVDGRRVEVVTVDAEEGVGVNTHRDLAAVAAVLRRRINDRHLANGVWMLDPDRVYVDVTVEIAPGARLYPETHLRGLTSVGAGSEIGPNTQLTDTAVGAGVRVLQTVALSATIGDGVTIGPFSYLRPGTVLQSGAKVGSYVEIKASEIGEGSKVPHLAYVGDATVGAGTNIGAGTVTVNYDGYAKHRTTIGDHVRIGADTMLVAPVTVGDDAVTGAGSVITEDVPPGALAVERSPQKNVEGYAERRRRRAEGNDD